MVALGFAACGGGGGGGGGSSAAQSVLTLAYTDPPPGGYRFVRDAGLSTGSHLVLDLVGPGLDQGRGVAFSLSLAAGPVAWSRVAPGDAQYVENALFNLGPGIPLVKTAVQQGTLLVDVFQKGRNNALALAGPICRVALDAQPPLTTVADSLLQVVQFQLLPPNGQTLASATCAVGALTVQ
jgi:hypothetical protein